jgi:hypothetical protein
VSVSDRIVSRTRTHQPFQVRDYSDPRRRARTSVVRALAPLVGRAGFDLEVRHFYSPIQWSSTIDHAFWKSPSELVSVDFDVEAQMLYMEDELARYMREFSPPREPTGHPDDFFLDNGYYQAVDAHVLYAMARRFKARILELGAGFSSLVWLRRVAEDGPRR